MSVRTSAVRICRDAQCSPELDLCLAWRRFFTRVDRAAFSASSLFLVIEEGRVERRKIAHQILDLHLVTMDEISALKAIPPEGIVGIALVALGLEHQSDRGWRGLLHCANLCEA
jgi:hypothetical protein